MNIPEIISRARKPGLYKKGTRQMWTDPHISEELLSIHLTPDVDLASRKRTTILKTAKWILEKSPGQNLNILDLGCGPGLYTEYFSKKGHQVTGVDFSKVSIEYAKIQAESKKHPATYINDNYLDMEEKPEEFDLVLLIYTDFGVLLPAERARLLEKVSRMLKKGGIFIFDVLNDKTIESKLTPKSWEAKTKGFWKNSPYLALSESFLYRKQKVILYQHTVIDEEEAIDIYRFWTHFFSHEDLKSILSDFHFDPISFYESVLPADDIWSGENVTFCRAMKK